jgi:glycerol kinase
MGAAYLAGIAIGFWESVEAIQEQWKISRIFQPSAEDNSASVKGWHKAVKACKAWAEET